MASRQALIDAVLKQLDSEAAAQRAQQSFSPIVGRSQKKISGAVTGTNTGTASHVADMPVITLPKSRATVSAAQDATGAAYAPIVNAQEQTQDTVQSTPTQRETADAGTLRGALAGVIGGNTGKKKATAEISDEWRRERAEGVKSGRLTEANPAEWASDSEARKKATSTTQGSTYGEALSGAQAAARIKLNRAQEAMDKAQAEYEAHQKEFGAKYTTLNERYAHSMENVQAEKKLAQARDQLQAAQWSLDNIKKQGEENAYRQQVQAVRSDPNRAQTQAEANAKLLAAKKGMQGGASAWGMGFGGSNPTPEMTRARLENAALQPEYDPLVPRQGTEVLPAEYYDPETVQKGSTAEKNPLTDFAGFWLDISGHNQQNTIAAKTGKLDEQGKAFIAALNDDQKAYINYLYGQYNTKTAEKEAARYISELAATKAATTKNKNVGEDVSDAFTALMGNVIAAPQYAVDTLAQGWKNAYFGTNDATPLNSSSSRMMREVQGANEGFVNSASSDLGRFMRGTGLSIGKNLLNRALFGAAGLPMMAVQAGAGDAYSAAQAGATGAEQLGKGLQSGLTEYLTEKISWGKLDDIIQSPNMHTAKEAIAKIGAQMATEGGEEVVSEAVGLLYDWMAMGDKGDLKKELNAYKEEHGGQGKAAADVAVQILGQLGEAGLGGSVSGGLMGGGAMAANQVANAVRSVGAQTDFTQGNAGGMITGENLQVNTADPRSPYMASQQYVPGEGYTSDGNTAVEDAAPQALANDRGNAQFERRMAQQEIAAERAQEAARQAEQARTERVKNAQAQQNTAQEQTFDTDRTSINDDPKTHTAAQMQAIEEYKRSADKRVSDFYDRARSILTDWQGKSLEQRKTTKKEKLPAIQVSELSEKTRAAERALTGMKTTGETVWLTQMAAEHIAERHGGVGQHGQDKSMRNSEDVARAGYVLNNFDNAYLLEGMDAENRNSDGSHPRKVAFTKKLDGSVAVIEVVCDNKNKRNFIKSMYTIADESKLGHVEKALYDTKKESAAGSPMPTNRPTRTDYVRNDATALSSNSISDSAENSNTQSKNFSDGNDLFSYEHDPLGTLSDEEWQKMRGEEAAGRNLSAKEAKYQYEEAETKRNALDNLAKKAGLSEKERGLLGLQYQNMSAEDVAKLSPAEQAKAANEARHQVRSWQQQMDEARQSVEVATPNNKNYGRNKTFRELTNAQSWSDTQMAEAFALEEKLIEQTRTGPKAQREKAANMLTALSSEIAQKRSETGRALGLGAQYAEKHSVTQVVQETNKAMDKTLKTWEKSNKPEANELHDLAKTLKAAEDAFVFEAEKAVVLSDTRAALEKILKEKGIQLQNKDTMGKLLDLMSAGAKEEAIYRVLGYDQLGFDGLSLEDMDRIATLMDDAEKASWKYGESAKQVQELERQAYAIAATAVGPKKTGWIRNLRYALMLLSPKTNIKNTAGNGMNGAKRIVVDKVAGVIESVMQQQMERSSKSLQEKGNANIAKGQELIAQGQTKQGEKLVQKGREQRNKGIQQGYGMERTRGAKADRALLGEAYTNADAVYAALTGNSNYNAYTGIEQARRQLASNKAQKAVNKLSAVSGAPLEGSDTLGMVGLWDVTNELGDSKLARLLQQWGNDAKSKSEARREQGKVGVAGLKNSYARQQANYLAANGEDASIFDFAFREDGKQRINSVKNTDTRVKSALADARQMVQTQSAAEVNTAIQRAERGSLLSYFTDAQDLQSFLDVVNTKKGYQSSQKAKARLELFKASQQHAIQAAQEICYHASTWADRAITELKRTAGENSKLAGAWLDGVLAFVRTPINVLNTAVQNSPVGLIKGLTVDNARVKNGTITKAQQATDIAAGSISTVAYALGMALASLGLLTGSREKDKESRFENQLGKQDNAITIPGVGSFTIDWLLASNPALLMGATMYERMQDTITDGNALDNAINIGATLLSSVIEPLSDLTMLSGLNDTLNEVSYADNKITALAKAGLLNFVKQWSPALVGQIARGSSPNRKETYYTDKEGAAATADRVWTYIKNRLPFVINDQQDYVDAWGNTQPNYGYAYQMLSPGYYSKDTETQTDEELLRLYDKTNGGGVLPSSAPTKAVQIDGADKNARKLTKKEYHDFAVASGQADYGLTKAFLETETYKEMNDTDRAAVVEKLHKLSDVIGYRSISDKYPVDSQTADYLDIYNKYGPEMTGLYITMRMMKDSENKSLNNQGRIDWLEGEQLSTREKAQLYSYTTDKAGQVMDQGGEKAAEVWYTMERDADADQNGRLTQEEYIPYLAGQKGLTDTEKGVLLQAAEGDRGKTAQVAEKYGEKAAGKWADFYAAMFADAEEKGYSIGSQKQAKAAQKFLDSANVSDDWKEFWWDLLSNSESWKKKNPYS